ncbi:MAG: anthranilate phosphoribosyltransferase [Candidatus Thermoplasmatota archaeon]|nr:anthranilate phosphoribosyltransferase [Candidatus Thermoplasmatota archaeon]
MASELESLLRGNNLSSTEAERLMDYLCSPGATENERISFLASMISKGVESGEIAGFARSLRSKSLLSRIPGCTDVVGTGGDMQNTINVSTCSALVAAAFGIKVSKHGNHAITGVAGSADFLGRLGYEFRYNMDEANLRLRRSGFLFVLAPMYNGAFSMFSRVRKLIGSKTVFNLLGPVTNPTDPDRIIIGCIPELADLYADSLRSMGKRGCVVSSQDGMDEISPFDQGKLILVNGNVKQVKVDGPGLSNNTDRENICSNDPGKLFTLALEGLSGRNKDSASFIALNTAPALMANGLVETFDEGYYKSLDLITYGGISSTINLIGGGVIHA